MRTQFSGKGGGGFTLVEILLATALFSMTMLIATSVFLLAQRTQRITAVSQKLQDDTRYVTEAMARDIKFTTIDYGCYNQTVETCYPSSLAGTGDNINLQTGSGQANVLALKDTSGVQKMYAVFVPDDSDDGQKKLLFCSRDPASEDSGKCLSTSQWKTVTPAGVQAVRASFWIFPFDDPYAQCDADCDTSPFRADAQPRVTLVLQTRPSTATSVAQTSTVQTTTISRQYYR